MYMYLQVQLYSSQKLHVELFDLSNVLRNFERVFESQVFGLKEEDWNMWDIVPE